MQLRFVVAIGIICVAVVLGSCTGSTGPDLVRATPTPSGISRAPAELRLQFRNELQDGDASVRINRGGGGTVPVRLRILDDGRTVVATPQEPLRAGTYQVVWRVTGPDGQFRNGAYDLWIIG